MNISGNTKIRHRNGINKTLSSLPLSSRRLIYLSLVQIKNPREIIPAGQVYRVYATEYAKLCGLNPKTAYSQLSEAAKCLESESIKVSRDDLLTPIARIGDGLLGVHKKKKQKDKYNNFSVGITDTVGYAEGAGFVDITFGRSMEPYICMISHDFTTQVLLSATRLKDPNSSSFYQLIRKNISAGKPSYFDISVNDFKLELGLYNEIGGSDDVSYNYAEFKDLNKKVIKKGIATITSTTEIIILHMDIIERKNRKASMLRFSYSIDSNKEFG